MPKRDDTSLIVSDSTAKESNHESNLAVNAEFVLATDEDHGQIDTSLVDQTNNALAALEIVGRAMSECHTIPDVRELSKQIDLLHQYLKKSQAKLSTLNAAAKTRIDCQRRMGEILKNTALHQGMLRRGSQMKPRASNPQRVKTLAELGISKGASKRFQDLADIPKSVLEQYYEQAEQTEAEITVSGLMRFVRAVHSPDVSDVVDGAVVPASSTNEVTQQQFRFASILAVAEANERFPCVLAHWAHDLMHYPIDEVLDQRALLFLSVSPIAEIPEALTYLAQLGFKFCALYSFNNAKLNGWSAIAAGVICASRGEIPLRGVGDSATNLRALIELVARGPRLAFVTNPDEFEGWVTVRFAL